MSKFVCDLFVVFRLQFNIEYCLIYQYINKLRHVYMASFRQPPQFETPFMGKEE
ncbi:hypothetical protein [Akkermansia sp.]|uniref:hypothetical protein n=1 Tax=Akkermansia TaxID=239934 RepID=UPI003AAFD7C3